MQVRAAMQATAAQSTGNSLFTGVVRCVDRAWSP